MVYNHTNGGLLTSPRCFFHSCVSNRTREGIIMTNFPQFEKYSLYPPAQKSTFSHTPSYLPRLPSPPFLPRLPDPTPVPMLPAPTKRDLGVLDLDEFLYGDLDD